MPLNSPPSPPSSKPGITPARREEVATGAWVAQQARNLFSFSVRR
jgi:hypothetical protein